MCLTVLSVIGEQHKTATRALDVLHVFIVSQDDTTLKNTLKIPCLHEFGGHVGCLEMSKLGALGGHLFR